MPNLGLKFFSIVILGDMNPQILNHNFLIQNDILPKDDPSIRALLEKPETFDDFKSIPGFSLIKYGDYEIRVEFSRFQSVDRSSRNTFENSPIIAITKNYFKILSHTPLNVGGFNLMYTIQFADEREKNILFDKVFACNDVLNDCFDAEIGRKQVILYSDFLKGKFEFKLEFPKSQTPNEGIINVNYEFDFTTFENHKDFLNQFDNVYRLENHFNGILKRLSRNGA